MTTGTDRAREVLARHKARLMAMPGVHGVGLGKAPSGETSIVVYVDGPSSEERPEELEAVPVQYVVTGKIKPLT